MDQSTQAILTATLGSVIRHTLTIAAGSLVTLGLLQSGQSSNFVEISSGIVMGGLALLWSWWQKKGQQAVKDELARLKSSKGK